MAITLGSNGMSLLDLAKQTGSDGKILTIAEVLNRSIGFASVPWMQGNTDGGNEYTVRSALPTVGTRAAGAGAVVTNASQTQGSDTAVHLEAPLQIDKIVYDKAGDKAKLLANESAAFIYAFGQTVMTEIFNGNAGQPTATLQQRINGFANKFNNTTTYKPTVMKSSVNTTGPCTSVYGVIWGPQNSYGFTGKNFQAGLVQGPAEWITVTGVNSAGQNTARRVMQIIFEFTFGLTAENWRQFTRFANVDYTQLTKNSSTGEDLILAMIRMLRSVQNIDAGRFHYYMNRDVQTYLDTQQTYKSNALLTLSDVEGRVEKVDTFRGFPVIMVDNNVILNTETAIS